MTPADILRRVALPSLVALAVAMGIGRFAFTPVLPAMLADAGLDLARAGWLAAANYLGYLVGALAAGRGAWSARRGARIGLAAVALSTAAMGVADGLAAWLALRFIAGAASAWIMVAVSAWALEQLQRAGRARLGGVVYAGVGSGIAFAGLACVALGGAGIGSAGTWLLLGAAAALASAVVWRAVGADDVRSGPPPAHAPPTSAARSPRAARYVFCYGAFGLGYIIPATFLPVMARAALGEGAAFGWVWPVFGFAALASTLLAAPLAARLGNRRVWMLSHVVMAAGVLLPAWRADGLAIALSALCVGGTFMVATMAGLQEARRVAGSAARTLIAAMTASFAAGQIAGPLLVSGLAHGGQGFAIALAAAAVPLLASAAILARTADSDAPVPTRADPAP